MSRTDLDATTLANSLRMRAGDGSIEWVYEPIQASVLLDIADMLDENAKLRELGGEVASILFNLDVDRCGLCQRDSINHPCPVYTVKGGECLIKSELRELGIEVEG